MPVRHADDVEAKTVAGARETTLQVLISAQEGPHFALRKFSMQKGGGMPRHTNRVEHEQYVLRGEATITIGDETHRVTAGDVVFIPAGAAHSYENTGDGAFEFLCIVPNQEDKVTIVGEGC
jgi:quercetin dioxygenase-like cupin family protein